MKKILIALLLLGPFFGFGAIEPLIIKLDEANPSYTVPAGKVLLIETMHSSNSSMYLYFITGSSTNACIFSPPGFATDTVRYYQHFISFQPSIKVPENTVLYNFSTTWSHSDPITLFCLLVELSDLYAKIETQTDNTIAQNGVFSFDIQTASARPAKVSVEGSSDLASWQPVDATVEQKAPDTYTVTLPADQEKYFAKYTVRGVNP